MLRGRHHRTGLGRVVAAFALLGVLVHALVPAGYMFAATQRPDTLVTVTLCSGHNAQLDLATGAIVDSDKREKAPEKSSDQDAPCVFAGVAHLSAPEADFALVVHAIAPEDAPHSVAALTPGRGLAAPPPWSTGPPLTL